ncbi:spermidine synthase [Nitrogeniibacter mangrovi]|uniref:Spermidine synthase n=1 Tax=Nitrogeniibacter mangrovi TaxID=2016596 RepID=A0A6C1B6Z1_9RHOO|nr:fused MFS/spermidine synthase [Nitrogeniibacter mangrovi]QID18060.1 spermidine synthase [Nitrogeniibacter mangrovi]
MDNPIDIREEGGVRYLHFGTDWVQGAMRIRTPFALELAYTREMLSALLFHEPPWPRRILSIGLGAGSLAKFIHRKLPDSHHTVVEIEPRVVAIAMSCFEVPRSDARLDIQVEDGLEFIARTDERWDLILLDAYDHDVRPGPLNSAGFYAQLRAHLSAQGVLSINMFNRARRYDTTIAALNEAFENRAVAFASTDAGNYVALGFAGDTVDTDEAGLRERAEALRADLGLDLRAVIARLLDAGEARRGRLVL